MKIFSSLSAEQRKSESDSALKFSEGVKVPPFFKIKIRHWPKVKS